MITHSLEHRTWNVPAQVQVPDRGPSTDKVGGRILFELGHDKLGVIALAHRDVVHRHQELVGFVLIPPHRAVHMTPWSHVRLAGGVHVQSEWTEWNTVYHHRYVINLN